MPPTKKDLLTDLLLALEPQLAAVTPTGKDVPKGVAKALKQLAAQLHAAQAKQARQTQRTAAPAMQQRLTEELLAVVQVHLGEDAPTGKAAHRLEEAAEDLATQVTKVRAKHPPQAPEPAASTNAPAAKKATRTPARARRTRPAGEESAGA